MHEFSICRSILREVERAARQHNARAITKIHLQLGPLATITADQLQQTLPLVSAGSIAADAALVTELLPFRVRCDACQAETETNPGLPVCGNCGAADVVPLSGDELLLTSVEFSS